MDPIGARKCIESCRSLFGSRFSPPMGFLIPVLVVALLASACWPGEAFAVPVQLAGQGIPYWPNALGSGANPLSVENRVMAVPMPVNYNGWGSVYTYGTTQTGFTGQPTIDGPSLPNLTITQDCTLIIWCNWAVTPRVSADGGSSRVLWLGSSWDSGTMGLDLMPAFSPAGAYKPSTVATLSGGLVGGGGAYMFNPGWFMRMIYVVKVTKNATDYTCEIAAGYSLVQAGKWCSATFDKTETKTVVTSTFNMWKFYGQACTYFSTNTLTSFDVTWSGICEIGSAVAFDATNQEAADALWAAATPENLADWTGGAGVEEEESGEDWFGASWGDGVAGEWSGALTDITDGIAGRFLWIFDLVGSWS